jgi:hypothetical protein
MKTAGYGNFEATDYMKWKIEFWILKKESTWKRCNRINRYHPVVLEQKQLLAAKTTFKSKNVQSN